MAGNQIRFKAQLDDQVSGKLTKIRDQFDLTVLLVEDDATLGDAVRDYLVEQGHVGLLCLCLQSRQFVG